MCWSMNAVDESRRSFGSSLRPHLNVGAMSHNCRTADHLLGLKTVLALGFRPRTSAAEPRLGVITARYNSTERFGHGTNVL